MCLLRVSCTGSLAVVCPPFLAWHLTIGHSCDLICFLIVTDVEATCNLVLRKFPESPRRICPLCRTGLTLTIRERLDNKVKAYLPLPERDHGGIGRHAAHGQRLSGSSPAMFGRRLRRARSVRLTRCHFDVAQSGQYCVKHRKKGTLLNIVAH
jgi:hypothetical protein